MVETKEAEVPQLFHDHSKCLELAGDSYTKAKRAGLAKGKHSVGSWNILMYVRKSDDIDEILDTLQDTLLYISQKI